MSSSVNTGTQQVSIADLKSRPLNLGAVLIAHQLVLAPLYLFLPLWIFLFNSSIFIIVYFGILRKKITISRWIKVSITLVAFASIFYLFQRVSGRDAGVSLIAIMYGLKIIEIESRRDVYIIMLLGFFILLAAFLFTQSPLIVLYQFIPVVAILYGLQSIHSIQVVKADLSRNSIHISRGIHRLFSNFAESSFRFILKQLLVYLGLAIPVMVVLFLFFPRLSGPIWKMPGNSNATSGISDSMSPGEISGLHLSDKLAFRVKFNGKEPKGNELYWRTLVLDHFDGLTWRHRLNKQNNNWSLDQINTSKTLNLTESQQQRILSSNSYQYEIALEATQQKWLTFLDRPNKVPLGTKILEDFSANYSRKVNFRIKYEAESNTSLVLNRQLTEEEREHYIQLPRGYNARSLKWAAEQRQNFDNDKQFIQSILKRINQQAYFYTLSPPIMKEDTVDSFWLDEQKGFCEHYSGALAFLARAVDIPARVVIGYQGAEKNPLSDYWIVRYANAHAWTEIWFDDLGWVRVDPTAAIAEHRIEEQLLTSYSQRESLFESFEFILAEDLNDGIAKNIGFWLDKVNAGWNNWFIEYNQDLQRKLMSQLGFDKLTKEQIALIAFIAIIGFIVLISLQLNSNNKSVNVLSRAVNLLAKKLSKYDIQIDANTDLSNILRLINSKGAQSDTSIDLTVFSKNSLNKLQILLKTYQTIRYGKNNCTLAEQKAFYNQVKKLKLARST